MKTKHIFIVVLCLIFALVLSPVVHLLKTYLGEDSKSIMIAEGFTNDASGLNLTPVHSIIHVPSEKEEIVLQLRKIIDFASKNKKKISIAGAKHSMGGHTIYPDGILLNMRPVSYTHLTLPTKA